MKHAGTVSYPIGLLHWVWAQWLADLISLGLGLWGVSEYSVKLPTYCNDCYYIRVDLFVYFLQDLPQGSFLKRLMSDFAYIYHMLFVPGNHRYQKMENVRSPQTGITNSVNHHLSAKNWTRVLCDSNTCSLCLSHLSRLRIIETKVWLAFYTSCFLPLKNYIYLFVGLAGVEEWGAFM